MADSGNRSSQPPSKVLHVRNLPYEVTEEELVDLCAPFGRLVQTKLNVGSNKNQAFVEFPDVQAAMQMVTYFTNSADPAKVRGKNVYLQYSTRQEIVNSTTSAENPSNVLLVSLESLLPDVIVTLDTLYLVFSAFGEVQKIATFEKNAGLQALVQYADISVADQVRRELDGRHIPRHLLNDTLNPPMFKISFSQHSDLNVKFQSHRSRDYTNQFLPVAPTGTDAPLGIQAPSSGNPSEGNVLLCAIENKAYPVTVDPLHTVFSPYGFVQKMAIFEKNSTWQVLVQYPDDVSAFNAKNALDGHAIYDGGYNRLKINFSVHRDLNVRTNNERSWDYTSPGGGTSGPNPNLHLPDLALSLASQPSSSLAQQNGSLGQHNSISSIGGSLGAPQDSFASTGLGASSASFGSEAGVGFKRRHSSIQSEALHVLGEEYIAAHNAAVRAAVSGTVPPRRAQPLAEPGDPVSGDDYCAAHNRAVQAVLEGTAALRRALPVTEGDSVAGVEYEEAHNAAVRAVVTGVAFPPALRVAPSPAGGGRGVGAPRPQAPGGPPAYRPANIPGQPAGPRPPTQPPLAATPQRLTALQQPGYAAQQPSAAYAPQASPYAATLQPAPHATPPPYGQPPSHSYTAAGPPVQAYGAPQAAPPPSQTYGAAQPPSYAPPQDAGYITSQPPSYGQQQQVSYGAAQAPSYSTSQAPSAQAPAYGAAQAPSYGTPQATAYSSTPQGPSYSTPTQAPGFSSTPQAPSYGTAQAPSYGTPQASPYGSGPAPSYGGGQAPGYAAQQTPSYGAAPSGYDTSGQTSAGYQQPAAGAYQQPSTGTYQQSTTGSYQQPASSSYQPSGAGGYQAPAGGYQQPAYQQLGSGGFQPMPPRGPPPKGPPPGGPQPPALPPYYYGLSSQ